MSPDIPLSSRNTGTVTIPFARIRRVVLATVAVVSVMMFVVTILKVFFGHDNLFGLARLFNPHYETSAHSWLGSVFLVLCGVMLLLLGSNARGRKEKYWYIWYVLGWGFVYLSFDEAAEVHEMSVDIIRHLLPGRFIVGEDFAFVAAAVGLAIFPFFWGFLKSLSPRYRAWFIGCGIIYVGGAVGLEGVAAIQEYSGWWSVSFHDLLACVEETMELAGAGLFLCTLLHYAGNEAALGVAFSGETQVTAQDSTAAAA